MWTKQTVDAILSSYKADKARIEHLKVETEALRTVAAELERARVTNAAVPQTQNLSGMPRGSSPSDPTAVIAVRLASGWEGEDIEQLKSELREFELEKRIRSNHVSYVEAWLQALNEQEHFVIWKQVINGELWRSIADDYAKQYGICVSQDSMSRLKHKALNKIYEAAGIRGSEY